MPETSGDLATAYKKDRHGARWLCRVRSASPRMAPLLLIVAALVGLLLTSCADDGRRATSERATRRVAAASPGLAGESPGSQGPAVAGESPASTGPGASVRTPGPAEVATPAPSDTPPLPTPPAPLAALVNGEYVFLDEYERRVAHYESGSLEEGVIPDTEEGQAEAARFRKGVLDELIDQLLIRQGAAALGVVVTDEQLDAQLEADIVAGGGEAAFDQWLQATGQSRDEYRQMVREALLTQRLLELVAAQLPAEMEQVHVRGIVLDSEQAAHEIRDLVAQGSDFGELAAERSQDPTTREQGGDMGWFPHGVLAPELERVAFALEAGDLDVVRLGEQYHVLQVLEKGSARPLSPEARIQLALVAFQDWLDNLRQAADIERFVE